jgi:hypothetical protein
MLYVTTLTPSLDMRPWKPHFFFSCHRPSQTVAMMFDPESQTLTIKHDSTAPFKPLRAMSAC